MRILVTGANRGIGLEMVRQCAIRGDTVYAACRQPDQAEELHALAIDYSVFPVTLELTDEASIRACAEQVASMTAALDLLINNAGIVDRGERLADLTFTELNLVFAINAFAPILLSKYTLDLLKRGTMPMMITISSEYGSLSDKRDGDLYSYCASKAALNMFTRTFHFDQARNGITSFIIDPGWVRTNMGGADADLSVLESVSGILRVIDAAKAHPSAYGARYMRWNGEEMPW